MRWLSSWISLLSISIIAGCTGDTIFNDDTDDLDDEVDEAAVTSANWEDWAGGAVFAATDPFEEPFFDEGAFLLVSTEPGSGAGLSEAEPGSGAGLSEAEPGSGAAGLSDAEAAAERVAQNVDRYYSPAGCANVERRGSELIYQLSECTGPFDGASMDGTLRVTLSNEGNRIAFELSSDELLIDGIEARLSASGSFTAAGSSRTVEYSSQRFLGGEDRFSGDFQGTLAWTAGSICVTRNATGEVETRERDLDVTVEGYARCGRACPTAGLVALDDDEETTTLRFNGGNRATLDRANGDRDQVALDCE